MEKWIAGLRKFYRDKVYVLLLCLTAVGSYGFKVTHQAMGIDDTPFAWYFEEGLAAIVGRWVLFLLNKVAHISTFAPFLTDLAAVLLLMAAVTVWSLLFYSILGEKIPVCGYRFFACIFLSCPLISEVFTYYLHNGIAIGYLCSGVSLCMLREGLLALEADAKEKKKSAWLPLAGALCFMVVAMGCYESFMVVWLVGVLLLFLAERLAGERNPVWKRLLVAGALAVAGMVMRSLVIKIVIGVFGLGYLKDAAIQRSIGEMLGWMFEPGASAEFAMVLKRVFVMYGVFAYAYYPIKIFVFASVVIGLFCLWRSIAQKDVWILLLAAGSYLAAFLLVVIEGKATYYRSAQFLPLLCGFGILLLSWALFRKPEPARKKGESRGGAGALTACGRVVFLLTAGVILWNQCTDMNRWFYLDYRKYEYARELTARLFYELREDYDLSKPVVFTGEFENPRSLIGEAYVDYGSKTFYKMKRLTDMVDEHLLEKFYRSYGVWVAQTPALSVINWGRYAFGNDEELVRFFAFHGYELVPLMEKESYEEAEEYSLGLPVYPQRGSIVDVGDYIIVHF